MKKNKDYSFNFKDVLLLQSLKYDGIEISNVDELSQYKSDLNPEIEKIINNNNRA